MEKSASAVENKKTSVETKLKLRFLRSDLINAIQTVQSSVSTKSTLPILSNLLLDASTAQVKLEATDLEVGIRTTVKAEIIDDGRVTLPAKKFGEIIRELPDSSEIEISSSDGKRVTIRSGKVKAVLPSLNPQDFPVIPEFPKKFFSAQQMVFKDMIRKTQFATSTDETRYILNGIFFTAQNGELRMVATDGRRLAYIQRATQNKESSASVIIPSKAITELARLLSSSGAENEELSIAPHENQIAFRWKNSTEEITLISRVVDGSFPNYEQVIPKSKEVEFKIALPLIFSAVKRAALFAQDRGGSVRFSLSKNRLRISANSQALGEEEEELDASYEGADFEIAFNPAFMLDVLKNIDAPEVQFEFSSALNPGLIRPAGDDKYQCVIMPMRLQ